MDLGTTVENIHASKYASLGAELASMPRLISIQFNHILYNSLIKNNNIICMVSYDDIYYIIINLISNAVQCYLPHCQAALESRVPVTPHSYCG